MRHSTDRSVHVHDERLARDECGICYRRRNEDALGGCRGDEERQCDRALEAKHLRRSWETELVTSQTLTWDPLAI